MRYVLHPREMSLRRYLDCSELKRRLKAEQKAKERAEKEEARTLATVTAKPKSSEKKDVKEEEISPNVNFEVLTDRNLYWRKLERIRILLFHGQAITF